MKRWTKPRIKVKIVSITVMSESREKNPSKVISLNTPRAGYIGVILQATPPP